MTHFTYEQIAEVCHEANRTLRGLLGEEPGPTWADADDALRESAVIGVRARAVEGLEGEALHERWCETKVTQGWVYGTTKDTETKTHPCLVPYRDLPLEQRAKDYLFAAIVDALT